MEGDIHRRNRRKRVERVERLERSQEASRGIDRIGRREIEKRGRCTRIENADRARGKAQRCAGGGNKHLPSEPTRFISFMHVVFLPII
jgi:hypothetical protein